MPQLPKDAERLLAVPSEEFVRERTDLARKLRDEGRTDDARAVAELKKPPLAVLAVNRAARDRPQAASDAANAAKRVGPAQLSGDADGYRDAVTEMERASKLLAEVAVANLSRGRNPSETMRRRVNDLLRGALANEETRQRLVGGTLTHEVEAIGFEAFARVPIPAKTRQQAQSKRKSVAAKERQARERLQAEVDEVRRSLKDAERRVRDAAREREKLAARLATLEAELDRGR